MQLSLPDVERELAQAVRSRDELAHTRPVQIERDIARLGRDVGESVDRYHWLDRQIKRYERDLEQAKPWQRREIRELRVQIDDFAKQQERITRDVEERSNRAHALQHGPDGPDAWQRAHAGDLAARTQQVDELTVQRDELRQREVERVLRQPPEYLTRVIGAEPAEPDKAHPWREAARTIEEYRLVNHVTDKKSALGREPEGSHRQLLEFEKAKRQALAARETLGLSRKAHEVTREAMPLSLGIERGHGRGQERGIGR